MKAAEETKTHQTNLIIPSAPFKATRKGAEEMAAETLSKKARPSTNSYKDDVLLTNASTRNDSEMVEGSPHQGEKSQKNQQGGNEHNTRVSKSRRLVSNNKDVSKGRVNKTKTLSNARSLGSN